MMSSFEMLAMSFRIRESKYLYFVGLGITQSDLVGKFATDVFTWIAIRFKSMMKAIKTKSVRLVILEILINACNFQD